MLPALRSSDGSPSAWVLYLAAMNHAVNDGCVYLLSSLFPVVLALFDLSVFEVGVLVAAGYLVSVILQPVVGRYSEGKDPRKLLAVGISIISVSILSFVLSNGFFSLLASLLLLRVGSSFYHPVGVSAISTTYSGSWLDRAMGFQSAFGNLGILLVFVLAAPVYLAVGWRWTFVIFAVVGFVDVVLTLALFSRTASSPPASRTDDPSPNNHGGVLGIPFFFAASMFISGGAFAVLLNYSNIFLESQFAAGVSVANLIVGGWIAAAFIGAISTGRWAGGMSRTRLLGSIFVVASVTVLALSFTTSIALFIPLLLLNGFALSATYPLGYSELTDYLKDDPGKKGRAFGVVFSAQTVGGSALGLATGYIAGVSGIGTAFLIVGLLTLLGATLAFNWGRTRNAQPRNFRNQSAATFATSSSVPGSSKRCVAPGTMTMPFSALSRLRARLFSSITS